MKTTKLVLGILTIIISCFVLFQSCAAGVANTLEENGESSGSGGAFVSFLMLAGAITMISGRKNTGKGPSIAGVVIFLIAALIAFTSAGSVFKDLIVWGVLCLILAAINLIAAKRSKKSDNDTNEKNDDK